jgi:hypothetical protein
MKESLGDFIRREYMEHSKNDLTLGAMDFERAIRLGVQWQKQQEHEDLLQKTAHLNRVEVIDYSKGGRAYTNYSVRGVELSFQDNDETLKIFVK